MPRRPVASRSITKFSSVCGSPNGERSHRIAISREVNGRARQRAVKRWHESCRAREHAQNEDRSETIHHHVRACGRVEIALHAPALYLRTLTLGGIRVAPNDLKICHCAPRCSQEPLTSLMITVSGMSSSRRRSPLLESPPKVLRESAPGSERCARGKGRLWTSVVRAWNREGPQPYVLCRGLRERSNARTTRFDCKGAEKILSGATAPQNSKKIRDYPGTIWRGRGPVAVPVMCYGAECSVGPSIVKGY
jgi:hypothetical protein